MEGQPVVLPEKLGLKPDQVAYTLHAPSGYRVLASQPVPLRGTDAIVQSYDWLQAFYIDKTTLEQEIDSVTRHLSKNGVLWISWPKKSSGYSTDLTDSAVRNIGLSVGLVDVKVVSIDDVWSALKFVYRLKDR